MKVGSWHVSDDLFHLTDGRLSGARLTRFRNCGTAAVDPKLSSRKCEWIVRDGW